MAKTKSKKNVSTEAFALKKKQTAPKNGINPFEVHKNREKISILGRKQQNDKGMPGISRGKATKKRKETLGREYVEKHKVNKFKDNRVGKSGTMTQEEVASARFIAERLNQFKSKKQSLFNLNDNEEVLLTHKGHTLEEVEQFHDTISDDDDDEIGKLDAAFTGAAHFGGENLDGDGKKRKSAIEDLIAEQKRRKAEMTIEKEVVSELTHKLDEDWRSLIPLMDIQQENDERPKPDDFDRALKEMVFERRGTVTDKLTSEDKLLKKEKARLEKLEQDRLNRMKGITEEEVKQKHRSADDLDDGYFLLPERFDQAPLAYDDEGRANRNEDSDEELDRLIKESQRNGHAENGDNDENGENESEDGSGEEGSDEEGSEEENSDNEDDADDFSDLVYEGESETELDRSRNSSLKQPTNQKPTNTAPAKPTKPFTEEDRKKMMEKAEKELPYTFELCQKYAELEQLLKDHNPDYQAVILDRMIKCNHPKVEPANREKMTGLFAFLLQYINDLATAATSDNVSNFFAIVDRITPHLYDLSHINPAETTKCFLDVIKEKQSDFRNSKQYPTLDTLIFFKLISSLYSTSDFRHTIVSPSVIFISQILTRSRVATRSDISSGLFLVTVLLEYTKLSKRFLPAAVNFLAGVLYLCIRKRPIEQLKVIPPFKSQGELSSLLALKKCVETEENLQLAATDLTETELDDSFKTRAFNTTILLAHALFTQLDNSGLRYLAGPFSSYLDKIKMKRYPAVVVQNVSKLRLTIDAINSKPLAYLVEEMKKPKTLRQLEPKFERIYDDKRDRSKNAGKAAVRKGLMHKIKKETKSAVREIRRDTAFLAKVQLKKRLQSDAERKEKVRRIFAEASVQQGELNALDRKKKHL